MIIWAVRTAGRRFLSIHFSTNAAIGQPDSKIRLKAQRIESRQKILVDYLTTTLGFSEQEACRAADKVTRVTHRRNPDLLVGFLKNLGLNNSDIKKLIIPQPNLLFYDVRKILQPKIDVLQDLGLSGPDIIGVLRCYSSFFHRGLNSQIKPPIQYLRSLLGSDENVVRAIKKYSCLIHYSFPKPIAANVELLKKAGFSNEKISKFIVENPRFVTGRSTMLEEAMQKVKLDFGISPKSKMFYHVLVKLMSTSRSKLAKKFEVLRSFGWSDSMVYVLLGKLPMVLGLSEDNLVNKLNFYRGELGYSIEYLTSHAMLLSFSLEKRVKPRFEVFRVLHEKKICKTKMKLYSVVGMRESKFIDNFLVPFRDEISDVYESYFSIVGKKN